jgi:CBS domain-containing protein
MTTTCTDPRAITFDPGRTVPARPARRAALSLPARTSTPWSVGDVMTTPPPVIAADAPLLEVIYRMAVLGAHEVVVTVGTRPVGVLTARHLLTLVVPAHQTWRPRQAGDLVAPRTPRLLPDLDLVTAARVMTTNHVDALPVVDSSGELIGLLTHRDILASLTGSESCDELTLAGDADGRRGSVPQDLAKLPVTGRQRAHS